MKTIKLIILFTLACAYGYGQGSFFSRSIVAAGGITNKDSTIFITDGNDSAIIYMADTNLYIEMDAMPLLPDSIIFRYKGTNTAIKTNIGGSGSTYTATAPITLTGSAFGVDTTSGVNHISTQYLPNGQIKIGNASNIATKQTPSGAWTISNTGVATMATGYKADGNENNIQIKKGGLFHGTDSLRWFGGLLVSGNLTTEGILNLNGESRYNKMYSDSEIFVGDIADNTGFSFAGTLSNHYGAYSSATFYKAGSPVVQFGNDDAGADNFFKIGDVKLSFLRPSSVNTFTDGGDPGTGTTYTMTDFTTPATDLLFEFSGSYGNFQVDLNPNPTDHQRVHIYFDKAVTVLTINPVGFGIQGTAPTSAAAGDSFDFTFDANSGKWYRSK